MAIGWRLAHVKSRQEALAEKNLRRQGFEVFCPYELRTIRHARKLTQTRRAIFPGYLFVNFDADNQPWRTINNTYGVLRLVSFGGTPPLAPPGFVENMASAADENGLVDPHSRNKHFSVGERVRIANGPFTDFHAIVEELSDNDRIKVLFDVMQSKAPVEIDSSVCVSA